MAPEGEAAPTGDAAVRTAIEVRAGGARVARVTISRPEKLNAANSAVIEGLIETFGELAQDDGLRAAVLTGAGDRAFMGGADINELSMLNPDTGRHFITRLHLAASAIRALPVPVIGRMRGYCLGAGAELAAACDFRVADESFVIGMPEVNVGLPSVIEAALLPMLIGWGRTREMLLTGMHYDAEAAFRMGLVENLVAADELDAKVNERLDQICAAGALAVRSQKALIDKWERLAIDQAIEEGIDHLSDAYSTDEPHRMMQPFLKK